jgi:hypothetical protein
VTVVALNCQYKHKPSTQIVMHMLQRPWVTELHPETLREGFEISYDRDWVSEHAAGDLVSLDASEIGGFPWTRCTLTLARESFLFPKHGNKIHVSLAVYDVCPAQAGRYQQQMLQLTPREGQPGLHGFLDIYLNPEARSDLERIKTSIQVRIMHPDNRTRPPLLFVQAESFGATEEPFNTGMTKFYLGYGALSRDHELSVSARYVSLIGELLWSIDVMPTALAHERLFPEGRNERRLLEESNERVTSVVR